jgi:hypothetical protein
VSASFAQLLIAWTEDMKRGKRGSVARQRFGKNGEAEGAPGRADGVPPWSLVAVFARPDNGFTIVY